MRITESQLRKVIRSVLSEQSVSYRTGDYGSTSDQVKSKPVPDSSWYTFKTADEAVKHASDGPLVSMTLFQDPNTGLYWYNAKYDTWGT